MIETIGHNRLSTEDMIAMRLKSESDVDRFFWFRWVTGHQAKFAMWQILAAIVSGVPDHGPASSTPDLEQLAADARVLMRGYSLMLLYTGSATREIYDRVIRAPMARQHPNVTGAWARDYGPIRNLLRGRIDFGGGPQAEALRRECAVNEQVHEGIRFKLVPSGISLLQGDNVNRGPYRMTRDHLSWLYDGIFLTSRLPVRYGLVVRQLIRRLHAIILDLAVNDLYPSFAPSRHEAPALLLTKDVLDRVRTFTATMLDIVAITGRSSAEVAA